MTIINLPGCLHCGSNPMLLLKVETTSLTGDKQTGDPQTLNPVVVCTTCGTLMVRVGGGGAAGGWLTHVPLDRMVVD